MERDPLFTGQATTEALVEYGLDWQEASDRKVHEENKRAVRKPNMNPARKRHSSSQTRVELSLVAA